VGSSGNLPLCKLKLTTLPPPKKSSCVSSLTQISLLLAGCTAGRFSTLFVCIRMLVISVLVLCPASQRYKHVLQLIRYYCYYIINLTSACFRIREPTIEGNALTLSSAFKSFLLLLFHPLCRSEKVITWNSSLFSTLHFSN